MLHREELSVEGTVNLQHFDFCTKVKSHLKTMVGGLHKIVIWIFPMETGALGCSDTGNRKVFHSDTSEKIRKS